MLPEVQAYLEELLQARNQILKTLDGVNAEGLNWRPLPHDTNSLFVLATHSVGSERSWFGTVIAGNPSTRDREAEFRSQGADITALRSAYAEVDRTTLEILSRLTAADLDSTREHRQYGKITVRWVILHVIAHYNEHLGQMRLTRQLWASG